MPVTVSTSLLAAHALPPEFAGRADDYIDTICNDWLPRLGCRRTVPDADVPVATAGRRVDAYCEDIAFSADAVRPALRRRARARPAGAHCTPSSSRTSAAARSPRATARCPATTSSTRTTQTPRRSHARARSPCCCRSPSTRSPRSSCRRSPRCARNGVPIAVATDCNPGSAPCASLLLAMNMARRLFGLTSDEVLRGVTRNAARALGMQAERGSIAARARPPTSPCGPSTRSTSSATGRDSIRAAWSSRRAKSCSSDRCEGDMPHRNDMSIWSGRVDAADGDAGRRWHQVVRPASSADAPRYRARGIRLRRGRAPQPRSPGRRGRTARTPAHARQPRVAWRRASRRLYDAGDVRCAGDALEDAQREYAELVAGLLRARPLPDRPRRRPRDRLGRVPGRRACARGRCAARSPRDRELRRPPRPAPAGVPGRGTSGTPFLQIAESRAAAGREFRYLCVGASTASNTAALFDRAADARRRCHPRRGPGGERRRSAHPRFRRGILRGLPDLLPGRAAARDRARRQRALGARRARSHRAIALLRRCSPPARTAHPAASCCWPTSRS